MCCEEVSGLQHGGYGLCGVVCLLVCDLWDLCGGPLVMDGREGWYELYVIDCWTLCSIIVEDDWCIEMLNTSCCYVYSGT